MYLKVLSLFPEFIVTLMEKRIIQIKDAVKYQTQYYKERLEFQLRRYWFRALLLGIVAVLIYQKDLSINLHLNAITSLAEPDVYSDNSESSSKEEDIIPQAMNTSLLNSKKAPKPVKTAKKPSKTKAKSVTVNKKKSNADHNLGNTYSNMTYTGKEFATKNSKSAEAIKKQKQLKYVKRFAKVAQTEMEKYGIPASITLAQGLLESNAGESRLATRNNNHFGIKCFSRTCRKGHCSNFTDDTHKDFFRKYKSAWESYRGHSYLLRADRYKPLYKLDRKDYKGWAKGLKKAGYATDKYYAEKLINLIDDLDLHTYDH